MADIKKEVADWEEDGKQEVREEEEEEDGEDTEDEGEEEDIDGYEEEEDGLKESYLGNGAPWKEAIRLVRVVI